jgi:hypothetical protein
MGRADNPQNYKIMFSEDQRTFDRWLKENAIVGLIFAAGLVAMALAAADSAGPRNTVVANSTKTSDVAASERRREQTGVSSAREIMVRDKPF